MKLLGSYKNGTYNVKIYDNGTKIRYSESDTFVADFPESIDLNISNQCNVGCEFCYQGCTKNGPVADLENSKFIIDTMHEWTEMAINGNNVEQKGLVEFLEYAKEKHIIVNMTVHQYHFMEKYEIIKDLCDRKLINGLGISVTRATKGFIEKAKTIPTAVLHFIVGIVTEKDLEPLYDHGFALLFLGYKRKGRGVIYIENESQYESVKKETQWLAENVLDKLGKRFRVLCFDNLAIEQLELEKKIEKEHWDSVWQGIEGGSTFYVDLVSQTYNISSAETEREPMPMIKNVKTMFNEIQKIVGIRK